jgi:3D-(3,5/4)-trihydroxycyclohexane-1,2-dione acylhydrolase (decyclizing)
VFRTATIAEFRDALAQARRWAGGPVLVHIETDPAVPAPDSQARWDEQRSYLAPPESR